MKKRDYRDYLHDILNAIVDIESFIKNMNYDEFLNDRKTINAVIRSIEVIGEAAKKIPESMRKKTPLIPWKKMAGMRDKMIHEYFGIDYQIVWKTAIAVLPGLKDKITELIDQENK
jgi:uncharacterized protein with HEPN domain